MLTLIEKAEAALDEKKALEMEKKLRAGKFDFEDYLDQIQQMRRLGPLDQILGMIPGLGGGGALKNLDIDEKQIAHTEAIIRSMTLQERRDPSILNGSRRKRIAVGSGTTVQDVNRLLNQYEQMRKMMRGLAAGEMPGMASPGHGQGHGHGKKHKKGRGGGRFHLPFGRG